MHKLIYILLLAIISISCSKGDKPSGNSSQRNGYARHAKGFDIDLTDSLIKIWVNNPFEPTAKGLVYTLYPDSIRSIDPNSIQIPVKRVVCMSSTHVGFIGALGADSAIVGISGTKYVNNPKLWERVVNGQIAEVGYDQTLNYELITRLKPDVVFVYGVSSESLSFIDKLKELGLKVVMVSDYLETSPLGRAEWIRFFGFFLGKQLQADSIFSDVELNYTNLSRSVQQVDTKPKVFLNLPFRDIWYFPGVDNYLVKLINDAGGSYVFPELAGSQSHPVSTEVAYKVGLSCDVWLNPATANRLSDITNSDNRFSKFKAFCNARVYNNNKRMGQGGGNDFWESGVVHPEQILSDLIKIFHPEIMPADSLYFYRRLE
jgi:iron complex transport system substrate-binding protein